MAQVTLRPQISVDITFTVTESEARALEAMAGYGADAFMDAFYKGCGKSYMQPHEGAMRAFLNSIEGVVRPALRRIEDARRAFDGDKKP